MKPLGIKNYGSIPHISTSKLGIGDHYVDAGQERILLEKKRDKKDIVFSHEKYDGSNVGICKVNGRILSLTRSGYEAKTSKYIQHHVFSDWVEKKQKLFQEILVEGERLAGEWMLQAHGLKYTIKGDPIVFFDFFTPDNKRLPQSEFLFQSQKYELKTPRLLSVGDAIELEYLTPILDLKTKSIESEGRPEGIVFRVERNGKVDFLAKWVRSDFEAGKYILIEGKHTWNSIL